MLSKARYLSSMSVGALLTLGGAAMALFYWGFQKFVGNAIANHDLFYACRIASNVCRNAAYFPTAVFASPARPVFLLAAAALVASVVKGTIAIAYSRRIGKEYALPVALPAKLERVCGRVLNGEKPKFKIADSERPAAFTIGIIRPSIYLTTGLIAEMSETELEAVVAHEYAHIKRKDNLSRFLASLVKDFLFPLPIVHFLFGLFMREKELAADELAVKMTGKPYELASAMLTMSKLSGFRPSFFGAALIAPAEATAEIRIRRLLGIESVKEHFSLRLVIALISSFFLVTVLAGVAFGKPNGTATSRNCHTRVDCKFTQSHGDNRFQNPCAARK